MGSVRLPGKVKHRLLPHSELPRTTGMTDRIEITACDPWLNQRLPTSANTSLICLLEALSGFLSYFIFRVKID